MMGAGRAHVARFLDYAPHTGVREVPDPYYSGGFEGVYRLVDAAADGLLAAIHKEHAL
jgi:protein-tyrosine phosphatase